MIKFTRHPSTGMWKLVSKISHNNDCYGEDIDIYPRQVGIH